jgi:hypothetical protein
MLNHLLTRDLDHESCTHTGGKTNERVTERRGRERNGPGRGSTLLFLAPSSLIVSYLARSLARSGAEAAVGIHRQRGNQPPRLDFGFPHGRGAKGEDPAENESPAAGNAGGHLRTRALGFARSYL